MRKLLLTVLVLAGAALAGDSYKEAALFDEGLAIRIEYRADGDRRGLMVFEKAGPMFFKPAQWKAVHQTVLAALTEAPGLAVGSSGPAHLVESASGSTLQVQAVRPVRIPAVSLAILPKGKRVVLDARQFTKLRAALAEVTKAL